MNNTGGPAFPLQTWDDVIHSPKTEIGMTLRDYFASQATENDVEEYIFTGENEEFVYRNADGTCTVKIRRKSRTREEAKYHYADVMLKARK